MKKVLIYLEEDKLAPKGGPYAVGYYICNELKRRGITNISFLQAEQLSVCPRPNKLYHSRFINLFGRIVKRYFRFKRMFKHGRHCPYNLNDYDIIHFHKTIDMYENRLSLQNYTGKVILTSHSPVPLSKEFYDEYLTPFEKRFMYRFYSQLIKMDEYAFQRADYILFPCEEAEEPYVNNWREYIDLKEKHKEKYYYIPTGIPSSIPKRHRTEVRNELGISDSHFCISYVGRHNYVKGYDSLRDIGRRLLRYDDLCFIIAGKEEPLKGLDHPSWKEIGWTNDAHSYIAASDVFILPNKETYFDIVMLEVLSLGKIVVASNTGGNKYFKRIKSEGIFVYNTIEEAVAIIEHIKSLDINDRLALGESNRVLFQKYFTDKHYVKAYSDFISNIE